MDASSFKTMDALTPTPYKVSTITATGSLPFQHIDLRVLYDIIQITEPCDQEDGGFSYIEYGEKKGEVFSKGYHKKQNITRRKQKDGKRFDNQATVIVWLNEGNGNFSKTNVKVFKNANIQMTGLKVVVQGKRALDFVASCLEKVDGFERAEGMPSNFRIRLINSDFRLGIDIKRDKLHKLVQKYDIFCSYEPCIYPGVKIQYNYNTDSGKADGVCYCTNKCSGKGSGTGNGDCKKITIAVFQSGCVIITGAQSAQQIDEAYRFIINTVTKHLEEVKKVPVAMDLVC